MGSAAVMDKSLLTRRPEITGALLGPMVDSNLATIRLRSRRCTGTLVLRFFYVNNNNLMVVT